jgi:beta-galactosidase
MALFRPISSKVYTNGFANMMDIVGQNYREQELVAAHFAHPNWKVIGTENSHSLPEWLVLRDNPFMAGQFLWTGFDYLGEAQWPNISYDKGLFDRTGGWKPMTYQRQSWWSTKPVVHIVRREDNDGAGNWVANWTPVDAGTYDQAAIQVYSNCDEVELFLNNKSLGVKTKPADDSPRNWETTYEKGSIKAVAKNNGKIVAVDELKTAGEPQRIILTANKPTVQTNDDDAVIVSARIVDDQGITCPNVDAVISFEINNDGKIIAVDNGNVNSHESYQSTKRHSYNGSCIAIIRAKSSSGQIKVDATSQNLKSGTVTIDIK